MRITLFFLFFCILLSSAANSLSQEFTINLKSVSRREVCKQIEKESDYVFVFLDDSEKIIDQNVNIDANAKNGAEILDVLLSNTGLTYKILDKQIVIYESGKTISSKVPEHNIPEAIIQQPPRKQITGRIVDAQGIPIIGANIIEVGTTNGTVTDADGYFSLSVEPDATIRISYIGYLVQNINTTGKTSFNIVLQEDTQALEEVVVIGYGTVRKSDLTGSVASVNADDIVQSKTISFMEALQGKLSGVQIGPQSGEPGAGLNIVIRGANSINADTQPLFVIDGIQVEVNSGEIARAEGSASSLNPLSSINPYDIESIEVLKDASATAIFGSRGANGVVIVTTKSGESGRSQINFNASYGIMRVPDSKLIEMASPQEYIDYRYEKDPNSLVYGVDTDGDGLADEKASLDDERFIPHDYIDELLRQGTSEFYNFSFRGGNQTTSFSSSLAYTGVDAIVKNNSYDRYNGRIKLNHEFNPKLSLGANLNFSHSVNSGVSSDAGYEGDAYFSGLFQKIYLTPPVEVIGSSSGVDYEETQQSISLQKLVFESTKETTFSKLLGNFFLDYSPVKGLSLRAEGGTDLSWSGGHEYYTSDSPGGQMDGGKGIAQNISTTSWYETTTLSYSKKLKKHKFDGLLGFEINKYRNDNLKSVARSFDDETTGAWDLSKGSIYDPPVTNRWETSRLSYFGRLNYNYAERYLVTLSMRADGSSKFGGENKFGYFPSGAFAWRVSEENFLKNSRLISNLKLRLSAGATGNDRIAAYSSLPQMGSSFYPSNDVMYLGLFPSNAGNQDLTWETTIQYDAGVDLGLFNNRIIFTADVFLKKTRDMLLYADIPSHTGFNRQFKNIGNIENKGFEFMLNTVNIKSKNFEWTSDINFNLYRNKVTDLGEADYMTFNIGGAHFEDLSRLIKGEPIGIIYGYEFDGIYQEADFDQEGRLLEGIPSISGYTVKPGDFKFRDISGPDGVPDGIVSDEYDKKVIGEANPDFFGGINNTFRYKNFDLNFFIEYNAGKDVFYTFKAYLEGANSNYNNIRKEFFENHWTPENPTNEYPSLTNGLKLYVNSYYVEDASYIKLKSASLGYTLPKKAVQKLKISNLRIYLSATNLLTLTGYSGSDPDVNYNHRLMSGMDRGSFPHSQVFSLGMDISL